MNRTWLGIFHHEILTLAVEAYFNLSAIIDDVEKDVGHK